MNSIFSLVQLLVFYSFSLLNFSQSLNIPLIFNPKTHQIYPEWERTTKDDAPYAIACPTSYNNEKIYDNEIAFGNEYSIDHKSIIVRHVVENRLVNFARKRCTKEYQLSAVVHSPPGEEQFIEIGYEVFFEKTEFNEKLFKESIYNEFQRVLSPEYRTDKIPIMKKEIVKDLSKNDIIEEKVDMGYAWLPKIVIRFDFSSLSMKSVTYFLDGEVEPTDMNVKCNNSYLGVQTYGGMSPEYYFDENQQDRIFKKVIIPESKENTCVSSTTDCVVQYNLVPAYQFQSNYSPAVSCSQLTTIPLWNGSIKYVLDYFENFLFALAQVAGNKLKITAGVRDILSFSAQAHNQNIISMYMDPSDEQKKHHPVPKKIFQIVSYQLPECQGEEDTCWFDTAIVFHNQPEVSEDDKICKEDKCPNWGYDSIQYLSTTEKIPQNQSKLVYCCELDAEMKTSLGRTKGEILDLKNFPYYDEDDKKIKKKNIQEEVEKKMK